MKKNMFFLLIPLVLFACKQEDENQDLIPRRKFIEVLVDVHIADALLPSFHLFDTKLKTDSLPNLSYYNSIFKKHNITKADFVRTYHHYSERPKELLSIYDKVLAILIQKQNTIGGGKKRPQPMRPEH